jgi:hypothetical protein
MKALGPLPSSCGSTRQGGSLHLGSSCAFLCTSKVNASLLQMGQERATGEHGFGDPVSF